MTDEQTPGQRLDALLAELRQTVHDLRLAVEAKGDELEAGIRDGVQAVSAKIDEIQAEWGHDEEESPTE